MSNQKHQTLLPMEMTPVPFGPNQYHAILVQLQMQQRTVEGLRETLHCAIKEMTSLKQENQSLKENVHLLETKQTEMKNQYEVELKNKDELLRREVKKRQDRTRAHVDCLDQLARQGIELEKSSEEEKAKCDALRQNLAQQEDGWRKKVEQMEHEWFQEKEQWLKGEEESKRKESLAQDKITSLTCENKQLQELTCNHQSLEDKVRLLESEQTEMKNQYEVELKKKDELLKREVKKRQDRTRAHVDCLDQLARQGIELEKSSEEEKAKCDALRQNLAQQEDGWRKKVEQMEHEWFQEKEQWLKGEEESKRKESLAQDKITSLTCENKQLQELTCNHQSLEDKVRLLESEQTEMKNQYEVELKKKDELLKREVKKRQDRTRAHVDCLDQLARQGSELEKSSEEEKAKCDALRQNLAQQEDGWRKKVEQMEHEWFQEKEQWLKGEEENKKKESLAQDKITFLISKNKQLQELTSTKRRVYPEENRSRYIQADRSQPKQAVNRLQQRRPERQPTHGPAQRANDKVEEKRSDGKQVADRKNPKNKRQPERHDHGFSGCHRGYSTRPSS